MAKVSESKKRANEKWDKENKERKQYINTRSVAKRFIEKRGTDEDLIELKNLITGKLVNDMSKFDKTEWTLRKNLTNSDLYQNNGNKKEYALISEFGAPRIKEFLDNSEIEELIVKCNPSNFAGSYYTIANKISLLF